MSDPLATGPYRPAPSTSDASREPDESSHLPSRVAAFADRLLADSDAEPADTDANRTQPAAVGRAVPPATSPAGDVIGVTVPGYEVEAVLGRGGMGVVYKGRHVGLNRPVALKMLLDAAPADGPALVRFLAEAEAVAAVRHPNVVGVYDFGEVDGRPYLAMEYLPGGTLGGRADGPFVPADAAALVEKLAGAVQAAHDLGIVHRDLKPGNVLFDAAGEPKVTDFGLAKRAAGADLTRTGAVMGTPAYMAPEQAKGDAKFVGPAADVYALGVILYELLTGTRPFADPDPVALLRKVADDLPDPPRKRLPSVPRDAELICLRCLEKRPADRYPTAAALADDLRRLTGGEPVSVRPAGVVERGYKWARRKPTVAALYATAVAGGVLIAVAATVGVLWREASAAHRSAETERGKAENARDLLAGEKKLTEAALGDLQVEQGKTAAAFKEAQSARAELQNERGALLLFEYGRTIQLAYQEVQENNVGGALAMLEAARPELRGWEWRYVHRLCNAQQLTLTGHSSWVYWAEFSPGGGRVLTAADDGTARVWDASTGAEAVVLRVGKRVGYAAWSPDGGRVLTASSDAPVQVWDTRTGVRLAPLKGSLAEARRAAWSPDGSRVAAPGESGTGVWDANTGVQVAALKGHQGPVGDVAWSPNGRRLATASGDDTARVWDAASGAERLVLKGHTAWVRRVTWSPDGRRVATASDDGTARVWDAETGRPLAVLRGHTGFVWSVVFSPDGARVLTASLDGTARVWGGRSENEVRVLRGHTDAITSADWSPSGGLVVTASADGTARVWDGYTGAPFRVFRVGAQKLVSSAAWSPDGARVVTASHDGIPRVWEVRGGGGVRVIRAHDGVVNSAVFSPNGRRVLTASDDGTARTWDADTGEPKAVIKVGRPVRSAAYSDDGRQVYLATGETTARVWDLVDGVDLGWDRVHSDWLPTAARRRAFSPHVRDMFRERPGEDAVWSPDGSRILTIGGRGTTARMIAGVHNIRRGPVNAEGGTGAEMFVFKGHVGEVRSAAWSVDGTKVVTAGEDGTVRIWDATPPGQQHTPPPAVAPPPREVRR